MSNRKLVLSRTLFVGDNEQLAPYNVLRLFHQAASWLAVCSGVVGVQRAVAMLPGFMAHTCQD